MSASQTAADAPILAALTAACLLQPGDSLTVIKMREYCKLNGSTAPGVLSCVCLLVRGVTVTQKIGPIIIFNTFFPLVCTSQTKTNIRLWVVNLCTPREFVVGKAQVIAREVEVVSSRN